jgi:hypothetical protein
MQKLLNIFGVFVLRRRNGVARRRTITVASVKV